MNGLISKGELGPDLIKQIDDSTNDAANIKDTMLKKDGSVQMTGVLKTAGGTGTGTIKKVQQIDFGETSVYSNTADRSIAFVSNAYHDGTNWRYKNDGVAMHVCIDNSDTNRPIKAYYAVAGLKDAIINNGTNAWTENTPLTASTGLPLTGGTISGSLNFTASPAWFYYDNAIMFAKNGVGYALEIPSTRIVNFTVNATVAGKQIYHTGNITVSTAAPTVTLAEGAQHQVYA